MRQAVRAGCVAGLAWVGGCTVGPAFHAPRAEVPAAWHDVSAHGGGVALVARPDPGWWRMFHDPVLDALVARAMAGNPGFQENRARIVQAREQEAAQRAAGLPELGTSARYTRERLGEAGLFSVLGGAGSGTGQPAFLGGIGGLTQGTDLYQVGFDASWELDLFGRVRRSVEQARAQVAVQTARQGDARLTLQGDVVRTYLQWRATQALLDAAGEVAAARARTAALRAFQRRLGLADGTDVDLAGAALARAQEQAAGFQRQAGQALNRLAILTGQPPGELDGPLAALRPLPDPPPRVPVVLPAALARLRPDIRAAEADLHAATAGVGAAVAQLYPDITLSGQVGQRTLTLGSLADWGNTFYQFGPAISLPLFQGGRLRAAIRLARAQQQEAALTYRQRVLDALGEVEDALVALRTDRAARESDRAAVASINARLALARTRYRDGTGDALAVLDARADLSTAQQDDIQARLAVLLDVVALCKATGGGWPEAGG
ncbi:efflux transporter outer membrane subunit [Gluconacetobacter tumulicola]|uniref:Efflux transporter outer membrane subunit n=1 Tax=Gluconacetobacter tumulicola TaxID=1017177 RepID=A0A7W4P9S7_9PROT|nr:efflux transporter outer membrane subunit [Gluconacetobacter tumulicola]MBB2180793.1 efflux transporter outer membrane subunit [Gluconacetobacter tumulicola]